MEVPDGVVGVDRKTSICKLLKELYDLKQVPRRWNFEMDHFLKKIGFICSSMALACTLN